MRGAISLRVLGIALVGAAFVCPFVACNGLTHIGDYQVDCFGCISTTCGDPYARCVVDPVCRQASICFQQCSPTGTIESCTNQCSVDGGVPPAGTDLIACIAKSCQLLCFGQQGQPPPPDSATNRETGADTTNDGTPGDGACTTNDATPVDDSCVSIRGATMISITTDADAGSKKFCIDEREVSWADYDAFLSGRGKTNTCGQIAECTWNDTFATQLTPPAAPADAYPVYGIDWCDAYAYCQWAGKRLCTGLDGKPAADPKVATQDMWTYACTNGGPSAFPYGDSYVGANCVTGTSGVAQTASKSTCVGQGTPFSQIFDMSGNVGEWEDNCTAGPTPESNVCAVRGGSFGSTGADAACAANQPTSRNATVLGVGFRCCAP